MGSPMPTHTKTCLYIVTWLFFSGCTLSTIDINRPLVIYKIPATLTPANVKQLIAGDTPEEKQQNLLRSRQLTESARRSFQVSKYNDILGNVPVQRLVHAIELVPANAYAWVQLGEFLALYDEMPAAIEATQRALDF